MPRTTVGRREGSYVFSGLQFSCRRAYFPGNQLLHKVPPLKGDRGTSIRRIIPYGARLRNLARRLRSNMTPAEKLLWKRLRRKQIRGHSFHRQRPIDHYIVDFYCPDPLLAAESTAAVTAEKRKLKADLERQDRLESMGLQVIRFSDQEVMRDIENVVRGVEGVVDGLEERTSS